METARAWMTGPVVLVLLLISGCSRTHYRLRADRETFGILKEKTVLRPWQLPSTYRVLPDVRARFFDPTRIEDPLLPVPAPQLYSYPLSQVVETFGKDDANTSAPAAAASPAEPESQSSARRTHTVVPASYFQEEPAEASSEAGSESDSLLFQAMPTEAPASVAGQVELRIQPLDPSIWDTLPAACRQRMLEFASVRNEYLRTYGETPSAALQSDAPRLTLEDFVDLAQINSREYQTQKEILYSAALRLTLERFDYQLKFTPTGNGTTVDFLHSRVGGTTVNTLFVDTNLAVQKILASGGELVARFANDVVLTFNGPDGFSSDVGSELLFNFSQSLLQRDIVFESLTQSERDVVYAARDFARFRKTLFNGIANNYYNLLLSYRSIEIGSQDYFSTSRAYYQGAAEYRADRLPRIQVDQLEQNALSSRSQLIQTCNGLESDLDRFKIFLGLPTETPLNIDLTELEQITLRDESAVLGERVRRARRNAQFERNVPDSEAGVLANTAIDLSGRMLEHAAMQQRLGGDVENIEALRRLRNRLLLEEAAILVRFNRNALEQAEAAVPAAPPRVMQRLIDMNDSLALLVQRQLAVLAADPPPDVDLNGLQEQLEMLRARDEEIRQGLEGATPTEQIERIPSMIMDANQILDELQRLAEAGNQLLGRDMQSDQEQLEYLRDQVDLLLAESEELLSDEAGGLTPVEIDVDDAMLTALVQRFDLMNQRGFLADDWRQIKLAADDLKAVLDLNAAQTIRTRADVNRPFDFTFDESSTRLTMTLDTPLNRKAQRNAFRQSLFNYQRSLRDLMALEDDIKLQVRDDLRQLALNAEQYRIAVASAALAFERVVSTRLQLQLGIQNVAARDFLEAQQDYTSSLSSIAQVHTRYLLNRIQLFLDLELLQVDESGFWDGLYDEQLQPAAAFTPPPGFDGPYGQLPGRVWYSRRVKRMNCVPFGQPAILNGEEGEEVATPVGEPDAAAVESVQAEPLAPE